ncbi:MAG TPA: glycosyltransferase family 39 protein [Flavisolibacter sp.]|nr:glycosyltransferase family 39 protein [Flavisolibacter sp.]
MQTDISFQGIAERKQKNTPKLLLTNRIFNWGPLELIILFTILQLAVTLLTDGFCLSFDEAIWHYIGRNWLRNGLVPYDGGIDNKSPLMFILFGISDRLFGVNYWFPRVVGTLCQSAGIYYLYKITSSLTGRTGGIIAMTIYALSLLWQVTAGKYTAVTETFEVTLVIISFYRYCTGQNKKDFFISGFLSGLGFAFRFSALFGALAIFIALARHNLKTGYYFVLGGLAAVCLFAAAIYISGINLNDFILYSLTDNFSQGSITHHSVMWKLENSFDKFFNSEFVLFYPGLVGYFLFNTQSRALTLWLIFELMGIIIIGLFAKEHFKDLLPVLSIINAITFAQLIGQFKVPAKALLFVIWLCFFPKLLEPLIAFKKLFIAESITGGSGEQSIETARKKLGLWVKSNTDEEDRVLVMGNAGAQVQVYSERLSPTAYFSTTQTSLAKARFFNELKINQPELIIIPGPADYQNSVAKDLRTFLDRIILNNYHLEKTLNGHSVYRKKNISN